MTTDDTVIPTSTPPPDAHAAPQLSYILYTDSTFAIADTWVTKASPPKQRGRNQQPAELIFISIAAAQHAIKAIRPNLRSGRMKFGFIQPLTSESNQPNPNGSVNPNGLKGGSFYETRLPKGDTGPITSHLIAIAKHPGVIARKAGEHNYRATVVYVFTHSEADLPTAFYRHFKEHSGIPTLPQWADQIWNFLRDAKLAQKMPSSSNIHAWSCEINDYLLTPMITEAVSKGELPIPQ